VRGREKEGEERERGRPGGREAKRNQGGRKGREGKIRGGKGRQCLYTSPTSRSPATEAVRIGMVNGRMAPPFISLFLSGVFTAVVTHYP
jgi:hypothetical protein